MKRYNYDSQKTTLCHNPNDILDRHKRVLRKMTFAEDLKLKLRAAALHLRLIQK